MGTILQFRQTGTSLHSASELQASLRKRGGRSAEIIIFPGVRIERAEKADDSKTEPKTRKRAKRAGRQKV